MMNITSHEGLRVWLKDLPAEFAQVIAVRAGLRALPYAFSEPMSVDWIARYSVVLFRSTAVSWSACNFPAHDMARAAATARAAAYAASFDARNFNAAHAASFVATDVANAVAASASAAKLAGADAVNTAVIAVARGAAATIARTAFWSNVSHDCDWLEKTQSPQALTRMQLWRNLEPEYWSVSWLTAARNLTKLDLGYDVWIDWFNRRIEGNDAAFDIPGDTDRAEDKAILARLAEATDGDLWDKGTAYVNAMLKRWIDEARARALAQVGGTDAPTDQPVPISADPPRITASDLALTTAAAAIAVASPIATMTGTQIDAIPNAEFDAQTDLVDVSGAIGDLQDLVEALLDCLPDNAPKIFAANLKVYARQLARPEDERSLNSLDMMHDAIRARFEDEPELYDVGVTTNIENYLKGHGALLQHFRKVAESKAIIAAIPMDEAAATGRALADPVDAVHAATQQLAEAGFATERFVEAIAEQKRLNDELAFYSAAKPPAGFLKRHVLQLYGFYERIISATSNTMSVVNGLSQFIGVVSNAIRVLRGFLGLS